MSLTRILNFYYEPSNITKDTNVIFTFMPPTGDPLSDKQNRAAWKVVPLKAGVSTSGKFTVTYEANFGFSTAQITSGKTIIPQLTEQMKPGQITTLNQDGSWTVPTNKGGDNFQARNGTDTYQSIAVGTIIKKGRFIDLSPTFLFHAGSGSTITANFHPTLMMYCTMDYQENDLMTAEISTDKFWDQNLAALQAVSTDWSFEELPNGAYKVSPL